LSDRGANIEWTSSADRAVDGADFLYTDVWASMGQDRDAESVRDRFEPFQVNEQLLSQADDEARVMHCLPAHRGEEITNNIIEGPQSIVFDQAENRLHVQKALLATMIENNSM
ncbi:MAG: ornithine carbamoyltransferase, partial [bacterium]